MKSPLSTPGAMPSDWGAGAASSLLECVYKEGVGARSAESVASLPASGTAVASTSFTIGIGANYIGTRQAVSFVKDVQSICRSPPHGHPLLGCSTARHRRCGSPRPLMPWLGLPTAGAPPSHFAAHDRTVTLPPSRRSPSVVLKPPRRIQDARVWKRDVGQADDAPLFHRNADARPARPW
jgi:hypothetical protein